MRKPNQGSPLRYGTGNAQAAAILSKRVSWAESVATFNYHRFWAEVDIATAFDSSAQLFPTTAPPSGFTIQVKRG